MAYACDYCGKTIDIGHSVSHAKNRTRRLRKPNLHSKRVVEGESLVRRLLCVKCGRSAVHPQDAKMEAQKLVAAK
jgi:large subunit ribosomal protein L28